MKILWKTSKFLTYHEMITNADFFDNTLMKLYYHYFIYWWGKLESGELLHLNHDWETQNENSTTKLDEVSSFPDSLSLWKVLSYVLIPKEDATIPHLIEEFAFWLPVVEPN